MTSAQVVGTSVTFTDNSPFQDYPHPDDHTTRSTVNPGFKPFTVLGQVKENNNCFSSLSAYYLEPPLFFYYLLLVTFVRTKTNRLYFHFVRSSLQLSTKTLSRADKLQLERELEQLSYNCGACFQDIFDIEDTVFSLVIVNDKLTCESPIEVPYYVQFADPLFFFFVEVRSI